MKQIPVMNQKSCRSSVRFGGVIRFLFSKNAICFTTLISNSPLKSKPSAESEPQVVKFLKGCKNKYGQFKAAP
ncbi:hypothetical protein L1887_10394 [Cichorium endivia]|nr:hypothetical protein L1887_10394 [Cichorium endivia]